MDFVVKMEDDLKGRDIAIRMFKIAKQDHSEYGAFVCFLMAHGNSDAIYGSDGVHQDLKDLVRPFHANTCPSLAHKPKIFFIQACRGQHAEVPRERQDGDKPVPTPLRDLCPRNADFLFCFASSEYAPAYRDPNTGSVFIQTLCRAIRDHYRSEYLVDIVAEVNRQVKNNPVTARSNKGKEMYFPTVTDMHSQLTQKVSLEPCQEA